MIQIVITNEKGGTGKSTIAALLVEYLNYKNFKVQLLDGDPLKTAQTWVNNCQEEGRQVSARINFEYQIIDTAGSSGSAYGWIREASLVLVPLQMNYADLKVTSDWFQMLNTEVQKKIIFLPNRWQNTIEQREGAKQLQSLINSIQQGKILQPLSNRPALYGTVLNGSKDNFFSDKIKSKEAQTIMSQILKLLKG